MEFTYLLENGLPVKYIKGKTIHQSEYQEGEYTDYNTVTVTETVEVDDSIYRTNENGEKELVLERTKTIEKPILDKEGQPVTKLVPITRNINAGIAIIPDDAKVITEEEYKKKLEEIKQL